MTADYKSGDAFTCTAVPETQLSRVSCKLCGWEAYASKPELVPILYGAHQHPTGTSARPLREYPNQTADLLSRTPGNRLSRIPTPVQRDAGPQAFFSVPELAQRWRCSRGTVYNRLRRARVKVLDFALRGKKGKKVVAVKTVLQVEERWTKRLV